MSNKERRVHPRLPVATELAEQMELTVFETGKTSNLKAKRVPTIVTNISTGGMSLIAFGAREIFTRATKIQLVVNLPGLANSKISGEIVHIKSLNEMQALGVRFVRLAKSLRDKIAQMTDDYTDCESRISFNIPEVCVGDQCHYFNLCNKPQKLTLPS
jgi:hypothetical protein